MIGRLSLAVVNHRVGSLGLWPEPVSTATVAAASIPINRHGSRRKSPVKGKGACFPHCSTWDRSFVR